MNLAISRKGAKTDQIHIDTKTTKKRISQKAKKIRTAAKTHQIYIDRKIAKTPIS
jgi:hypothetical protein